MNNKSQYGVFSSQSNDECFSYYLKFHENHFATLTRVIKISYYPICMSFKLLSRVQSFQHLKTSPLSVFVVSFSLVMTVKGYLLVYLKHTSSTDAVFFKDWLTLTLRIECFMPVHDLSHLLMFWIIVYVFASCLFYLLFFRFLVPFSFRF